MQENKDDPFFNVCYVQIPLESGHDQEQKVKGRERIQLIAIDTGGKDPNTQWGHAEYIVIVVFQ